MGTKTEYMVADFAIEAKDEQERTFEGTLSTSHLDLGDGWGTRDVVHPGAFKRTMGHFRRAKEPYVPLVDSHRYHSILNVFGHLLEGEEEKTGRTLSYDLEGGKTLKVDEMFFRTKWQIIDGPDGDRVLDRLRPGSVRKMSMGYKSVRADFAALKEGGRVRNLREVGLKEGSLVVFPMNPNADVDRQTVKAEIEALLSKDDGPEGLAPEDPRRREVDARLVDLRVRRLATRPDLG